MSARYGQRLRLIHWVTAVLVAVQVSLALLNIALYEPRPVLAEALVQSHISVGAVLFLLTVARVFLRCFTGVVPRSDVPALRYAAMINHCLLYVCLLVLPITGYLKLAALGFTVTPFGLLPLPALSLNVPFARMADLAHDGTAILLSLLLSLHIAAAILHHR
ncbi:MAG: cytochrome b/b6 domain-containing protein [Pseudomonadota bacterium]